MPVLLWEIEEERRAQRQEINVGRDKKNKAEEENRK